MTILLIVEILFGVMAVCAMMNQIFFPDAKQPLEKSLLIRIDIGVMLGIVLIFHYLRTQ